MFKLIYYSRICIIWNVNFPNSHVTVLFEYIKFGRLLSSYPLTAVTAIWRFGAITHAAIHQTHPDKFLTRFDTQCTYSETQMPIGARLLG